MYHGPYGIFTDIYPKNQPDVGTYRPYMDAIYPGKSKMAKDISEIHLQMLHVYQLPFLKNIAPENGPSQRETSIPTIHFQGLYMLVIGRVVHAWIWVVF